MADRDAMRASTLSAYRKAERREVADMSTECTTKVADDDRRSLE